MTSNVPDSRQTTGQLYLEWSVVGVGTLGGMIIAIAGVNYGLTNATGVGAGFFPLVAGCIIALGSVMWALQLVTRSTRPSDAATSPLADNGAMEEPDDVTEPDRRGVLRVAIVAGSLIIAAILLPVLGYLVTMTLLLLAVMTLVSARRWNIALLVAVGTAMVSRFVFADLLGTALPHSTIGLLRMIGL